MRNLGSRARLWEKLIGTYKISVYSSDESKKGLNIKLYLNLMSNVSEFFLISIHFKKKVLKKRIYKKYNFGYLHAISLFFGALGRG